MVLLASLVAVLAARRSIEQSDDSRASTPISEYGVGALGRIEPQSRVIKVNAPSTMEPPVVEKLHVDVEVLQRELHQHESTLVALKEVRTVDVEHALAEVARARAELQRADADLEISMIRSPIAGSILRVNSRGGERIGTDGLLELGDTRQMDVVAEVHESDILKVKVSMSATVILRNLDRTLHGHVIEIGGLVGRNDVLSDDPVDDTDARVVEVRIRLDAQDGQLVTRMSYARVEVTIDTRTDSTSVNRRTTELSQQGNAR